MRPGFEPTKVLITVMTYPHPSKKYQETVCVAGVTESGEWVRLYPVDYRYRPKHQKFRKWQWIDVALGERGHGTDQRVESREPDLSTILFAEDRDTRFFMGTRHPYNEWLVLGTFWPPKVRQAPTLFGV